ncbi:hypothetical protein DRE_02742 [Drechslerella stenobrocha 248]|uniref:Uncharacterized protein n=1 Tax=Drechslerella stenobrocha 248 TaxID=1043628 RepID=W7IFE6_9PEZI|nr:hypothetical protein DRE_02742 [Drechslerella stenobrocha 248]
MPADAPSYTPSDGTVSTSTDDMTLTNPTNPRASVAPSTEKSDAVSNVTESNSEPIPQPPPPAAAVVLRTSTDLIAPKGGDFPSDEQEKPALAGSSMNDDASLDPASGLPERKSSILHPPLPPLPFHLRDHRLAVTLVVLVMFVDHGIFPPVFYFAVHYTTNISLTTIFGVITGIFGVVLGIECFVRSIKLILTSSRFRPLGQEARFGMDFWQFSLCTCLIINVVCVSTGTALEPPSLRLMAMPMPTLIFNLSWQLLLSDFLHERKIRTPFRVSSTPKGEVWPRFISVIIEDFIAVDCNGKREWRQAWKDRVAASRPMRQTLKQLSTYWGVGGLCVSALCFGLLWGFDSMKGREAGYALGWLLPWAWIVPSTVFTIFYVKSRLKDERHYCQRNRNSFSA